MMHRDDSARRPSGKDLVNLSRVIPEISGDRDGFAGEDASECGIDLGLGRGQLCRDDLKIEQRWLIDPNQLLLGPKIGEGGHAKVYEGLYKSASVAVKIVHPGGTAVESARRRERFLREIEMLSRVQHENLVTLAAASVRPVDPSAVVDQDISFLLF